MAPASDPLQSLVPAAAAGPLAQQTLAPAAFDNGAFAAAVAPAACDNGAVASLDVGIEAQVSPPRRAEVSCQVNTPPGKPLLEQEGATQAAPPAEVSCQVDTLLGKRLLEQECATQAAPKPSVQEISTQTSMYSKGVRSRKIQTDPGQHVACVSTQTDAPGRRSCCVSVQTEPIALAEAEPEVDALKAQEDEERRSRLHEKKRQKREEKAKQKALLRKMEEDEMREIEEVVARWHKIDTDGAGKTDDRGKDLVEQCRLQRGLHEALGSVNHSKDSMSGADWIAASKADDISLETIVHAIRNAAPDQKQLIIALHRSNSVLKSAVSNLEKISETARKQVSVEQAINESHSKGMSSLKQSIEKLSVDNAQLKKTEARLMESIETLSDQIPVRDSLQDFLESGCTGLDASLDVLAAEGLPGDVRDEIERLVALLGLEKRKRNNFEKCNKEIVKQMDMLRGERDAALKRAAALQVRPKATHSMRFFAQRGWARVLGCSQTPLVPSLPLPTSPSGNPAPPTV